MNRDLTPEEEGKIDREQTKYNRLEAERVRAMNSRDAAKYSRLCTELGVDPELPELIERAEADRISQAQGEEGRELRNELDTLTDELDLANHVRTDTDRINWLRSRGYNGVRVAEVSGRTVDFSSAPSKNIYALYMREKGEIEDRAREIREILKE